MLYRMTWAEKNVLEGEGRGARQVLLSVLEERFGPLSDDVRDRIEKILIPERLGQEIDGAGLHGPYAHRDVAMTSDEDDRHPDVEPFEKLRQFQPREPRQVYVEEEAGRGEIVALDQEIFRGAADTDPEPCRGEQPRQRSSHRRIIVHDHDVDIG